MHDIALVIFRSISVYLFIIIAIRLFGKRELSQLSVVDLVFILLISNSVQNAMVGADSSLLGGLAAATALFIANWVLKNVVNKSSRVSQVIQGNPVLLAYKGKVIDKHLKDVNISHGELDAAIREHGVMDVSQVDQAILEVDGNISIISGNYQKRTKKRRIHKTLGFHN